MASGNKPIPSFAKPPVVETVWSVQFSALPWLTAAHTGIFWHQIKDRYPKCQELPPLEHIVEVEDLLLPKQQRLELRFRPPLCRQWFLSETGNDLVQLQPDRFCVNWRKLIEEDIYPRHEYVRRRFEENWEAFDLFVRENGGESPRVDQCEITYCNHIYKGEAWSDVGDFSRVCPVFAWPRMAFLPRPATLGWELVFDIRGRMGRLHVVCEHGKTQGPQSRELLRLELTARGAPSEADSKGILSWFSDAREWVVRGFADVTGPAVHDLWERKQ